MKTLLTRSKYFFAVFMASFIALSGLMALMPQATFAAPGDPAGTFYELPSAHEQAVVWTSYIQATDPRACIISNNLTTEQIVNNGQWLEETTEKFGYHIDADGDANMDCDNENGWFTNLLGAAGYTSGQYAAEAQKVFDLVDGKYMKNSGSDAALKAMLAKNLFNMLHPVGPPGQVTYAILFENFTASNGCNASTSNSNNPILIWEFKEGDPSTVEQVTYGYDSDVIHKPIGLGYGTGVYTGNEVECATIARTLRDNKTFAEAMLAWNQATGNGLGDTGDGTVGSDPELDCTASWSPLSWFICPIVKLVNGFISGLDNAINAMLYVEQDGIFNRDTDSGAAYYLAWQAFRNIALGLLFVAALTMLIAQAFGWEILDAYTVKKILPRVLVSIIGISLSWDIMNFFVGVTNDLGVGIRQLIYWPFKDINNGVTLGGGAQVLLTLLTSGAIIGMTLVGLLSFAVTAALGLIIAFMVLVIRQLVIVVLILFSPIAIACYILPNTQGVWKLWYESFTKAMMMFPIIVAFLAVGRVFALTATADGAGVGGLGAISQLIGLAAYILPYFLIPLTFRFAGGALRTIGGFANDQGRGSFDRLKKFRQGKTAGSMEGMKHGTRYRPNNAVARRFNATTKAAATAPSAGLNPFQMRSRYTAAKAQQTFDAAEEIRTKSADFGSGAQDDRLLRTAADGVGRADIRRRLQAEGITNPADLDTAVGTVERMQSSGSRDAVRAAVAIQRLATGTGYNDANGNFDYQEAMNTIRDAGAGDRGLQGRLLGNAKGVAAQAGQLGFGGASYTALNRGLEQSIRGETVDGSAIALNAFESNDAVSIVRARNPHVQAMTQAASQRIVELNSGAAPRDAGELGRLTAQLENFRETAGMYAAPERQTTINNVVVGSETVRREVRVDAANQQAAARQAVEYPVFDINTRQPIPPSPPTPDARQYDRNRNSRQGNYNDPNLPDREP